MSERAGDDALSLGARAERHLHERLRAALSPEYTMLTNVAWLVRQHGVEREGEADIILAHPAKGFLVIDVKAGQIKRDSLGQWWASASQLDRSPFEQAADSHHSLVAKMTELPDWEAGLDPIAGHAVAFPNVDLASLDASILIGTSIERSSPPTRSATRGSARGSIGASSCGRVAASAGPARRASTS